MNEHFRVAHKLGLMFRPDEALPRDIKSWAIKQLKRQITCSRNQNVLKQNKFRLAKITSTSTWLTPMMNLYRANTNKEKREEMIWRAMTQKLPRQDNDKKPNAT